MDSRGVPLAHYRTTGCGVRLTCRDCMVFRDLPLEPVLAHLAARGVAGERVGIVELAGFVRAPCARCGGRRFITAPAFPKRGLSADQLPPAHP